MASASIKENTSESSDEDKTARVRYKSQVHVPMHFKEFLTQYEMWFGALKEEEDRAIEALVEPRTKENVKEILEIKDKVERKYQNLIKLTTHLAKKIRKLEKAEATESVKDEKQLISEALQLKSDFKSSNERTIELHKSLSMAAKLGKTMDKFKEKKTQEEKGKSQEKSLQEKKNPARQGNDKKELEQRESGRSKNNGCSPQGSEPCIR